MQEIMNAMDIAFPNLGIYLKNVPSGFKLGDFDIYLYGIVIWVGVLAGILMAERAAKVCGMDPDEIWDFAIWAVVFSVIGARVYYVIFEWDSYKNDLWSILNIRNGGLAIYGAVIGAFITCFVFCKIKKRNPFQLADCGVQGLILGQIIGRWGNFFNSEAFGTPTNLPWKLFIAEQYRPIPYTNYEYFHPTFLYESVLNLGIFLILLYLVKNDFSKRSGNIALAYLLLYSTARIFVEHFRIDSVLYIHGIPIAIIVSVCIIFLSAIMLIKQNFLKRT